MVDKTVTGLLNGIAKRDYFNEADISNDFLRQELFPDASEEEFEASLSKYHTLLKNMVYSDMDLKQLEAFLTSQMKKKADYLSEAQAASITKFWKINKQKIHNVIVNRSTMNNKLKSFSWRIDLNYQDNEQISEPKVVFEIDLEKKSLATKHDRVVFEVDSEKLDGLIKEVEKIESKITDTMK